MTTETRDPADDLTIKEANSNFESQGFDTQLAAVEGGHVKCFACGTTSPANQFQVEQLDRTEGASDPAEMVANLAVSCPSCGAKGILTLKYGPEASLEDQEVLQQLDDTRPL